MAERIERHPETGTGLRHPRRTYWVLLSILIAIFLLAGIGHLIGRYSHPRDFDRMRDRSESALTTPHDREPEAPPKEKP